MRKFRRGAKEQLVIPAAESSQAKPEEADHNAPIQIAPDQHETSQSATSLGDQMINSGSETPAPIRATVPHRPPMAAPAARGLACIIALALILVGGACAYEIWAQAQPERYHLLSGYNALLELPIFNGVGVASGWIHRAVAIALIVVGVIFMIVSGTPRKKTHVKLAGGNIYLRLVDLARLATGAAQQDPAVASAVSTATRRKITVSVVPVPGAAEVDPLISQRVAAAVEAIAQTLEQPPTVEVKVRRGPQPAGRSQENSPKENPQSHSVGSQEGTVS